MNIEQTNNNKATSWKILPGTDTLIQYLYRDDLVELSKCCKRYRNQLERQILGRLYLFSCKYDDMEIYSEPREACITKKELGLLKNDLGSKLKYVNSADLLWDMSKEFTETCANLLLSIKVLRFYGNCDHYWGPQCVGGGDWQQSLATALNCMGQLEHVKLNYVCKPSEDYIIKKQIFPKSLKSLEIDFIHAFNNENESLAIYDTIDASYINLYSISIASNRMLRNLSSGMSNLQEVEIGYINGLDRSILVDFIKANPQLKKLSTSCISYKDEIFKTILSLKCLEYWYINSGSWESNEVNSLPYNYSIKHLRIYGSMPAPLTLKIINACKNLKTLQFASYYEFTYLDWSKLERRINKLKLAYNRDLNNIFKEIDSSKLFNQVYIHQYKSIEKFKEEFYNVDNLKNYKFIPLVSRSCTLKLINND